MSNPIAQAPPQQIEKDGAGDPAPQVASSVCSDLLSQHAALFARVKRLGMRSEAQLDRGYGRALGRVVDSLDGEEMAAGYAALKATIQTQLPSSQLVHEPASDPGTLVDALAALDALNPSSPEWGPTLLEVSEWVEAHARH